ncbi:MAG: hypothetical protein JSU69_09330 [Candidatus Zixiibacteriota bacterium]|nr:MAG: hypothetical protein JSU69_09330 [candidate division Zixibacteria bacterium]
MYTTLFEGTKFGVLNFVYPHHKLGGFGVSLMTLGTGDIEGREDWVQTGEFSYHVTQVMLGYGIMVPGNNYVGSSFKFVDQSFDKNSSRGFGFDLSFYRPLHRNIACGIIFQDIVPPTLKPGAEEETWPFTFMTGVGLKDLILTRDVSCNASLSIEKPEKRSVKTHFGAEALFSRAVALRAGFDRGFENFAMGIGYSKSGLKLDFSYRLMDEIDNSLRVGISWTFGKSVSESRQEESQMAEERKGYLIFDDRERQFEFYRDLGDYYQRENELDSAFIYYHRALAYRENDPDVLEEIDNVTEAMQTVREQEEMRDIQARLNAAILDEYYNRAEKLYDEKDYSQSLALVRLGLDIDPRAARLQVLENRITQGIRGRIVELLNEATLAESEGRWEDAITTYDRILELSPTQADARELKGRLGDTLKVARLVRDGTESFHKGNLSAAEEDFKEVLTSVPNNIVAQEYLRQIKSIREQPTGREELERDEQMWKVYLEGLEFYQEGKYDSAIARWEEVLRFYPDNQQTIENIRQARLRLKPEE